MAPRHAASPIVRGSSPGNGTPSRPRIRTARGSRAVTNAAGAGRRRSYRARADAAASSRRSSGPTTSGISAGIRPFSSIRRENSVRSRRSSITASTVRPTRSSMASARGPFRGTASRLGEDPVPGARSPSVDEDRSPSGGRSPDGDGDRRPSGDRDRFPSGDRFPSVDGDRFPAFLRPGPGQIFTSSSDAA